MTTIDAVEAAVTAAIHDDLDIAGDSTPDVTGPDQGPCSPAEAKELISQAIDAADRFQSVMEELLNRKAHLALGYSNPREMLLREFKDSLINTRTGKPYSDSHLHRMGRVAWLTWAIAERTGVDMTELTIPERPLREITSGFNDKANHDLVDEIANRVEAVAADQDATPDAINDVIAGVLDEASGRAPRAERDPDDMRPIAPDGDFYSQQGEGEFGGRAASTRTAPRADGADDDGFDDGSAGGGSSGGERGGGQGRSTSPDTGGAMGAFDADDPIPAPPLPEFAGDLGLDMGAALQQLREADDFNRHVQDIITIGDHLPAVTAVQAKLPGFLDAIDDQDRQTFMATLREARDFVEAALAAKQALDAILEEAEFAFDTDF